MTNPWPTTDEAVFKLCLEATNLANQLGHRIVSFMSDADGTFRAICVQCGELAIVKVRRFRSSPISGVAATMRCTAMRAA